MTVSSSQVVLFWLLVSGMTIILCCLMKSLWFCILLSCYAARDTHFSALVIPSTFSRGRDMVIGAFVRVFVCDF